MEVCFEMTIFITDVVQNQSYTTIARESSTTVISSIDPKNAPSAHAITTNDVEIRPSSHRGRKYCRCPQGKTLMPLPSSASSAVAVIYSSREELPPRSQPPPKPPPKPPHGTTLEFLAANVGQRQHPRWIWQSRPPIRSTIHSVLVTEHVLHHSSVQTNLFELVAMVML